MHAADYSLIIMNDCAYINSEIMPDTRRIYRDHGKDQQNINLLGTKCWRQCDMGFVRLSWWILDWHMSTPACKCYTFSMLHWFSAYVYNQADLRYRQYHYHWYYQCFGCILFCIKGTPMCSKGGIQSKQRNMSAWLCLWVPSFAIPSLSL